jgi:hypothetical protein
MSLATACTFLTKGDKLRRVQSKSFPCIICPKAGMTPVAFLTNAARNASNNFALGETYSYR